MASQGLLNFQGFHLEPLPALLSEVQVLDSCAWVFGLSHFGLWLGFEASGFEGFWAFNVERCSQTLRPTAEACKLQNSDKPTT